MDLIATKYQLISSNDKNVQLESYFIIKLYFEENVKPIVASNNHLVRNIMQLQLITVSFCLCSKYTLVWTKVYKPTNTHINFPILANIC